MGTAALSAACWRSRAQAAASLGMLAYVEGDTLWLRTLPDGTARLLAAGQRIANPKFSATGQSISFRDGDVAWIVSMAGKVRRAPAPAATAEAAMDESRTQYAWTSSTPDGRYADGVPKTKTRLLLSSLGQSGEPKRLDETEGFFEIAGFTRIGEWLVYWRAPEMSMSVRADGLPLYAANTQSGESSSVDVTTLVHEDMVAFSPVKNAIAITAGAGRETWANKTIAIIDLSSGMPSVRNLTDPSVSTQLPAWSPDGEKLAWSAGPDAEALHKQQLLANGQQTIRVITPNGTRKEVPITRNMRLGAPPELVKQCVRSRRIWWPKSAHAIVPASLPMIRATPTRSLAGRATGAIFCFAAWTYPGMVPRPIQSG